MTEPKDHATNPKAWPFAEARALLKRVGGNKPEKGYVLFETGYGPSGLPHIGTFGEVARTAMVRHAFPCCRTCPASCLPFPTTWTGSGKCPTTCLTPR